MTSISNLHDPLILLPLYKDLLSMIGYGAVQVPRTCWGKLGQRTSRSCCEFLSFNGQRKNAFAWLGNLSAVPLPFPRDSWLAHCGPIRLDQPKTWRISMVRCWHHDMATRITSNGTNSLYSWPPMFWRLRLGDSLFYRLTFTSRYAFEFVTIIRWNSLNHPWTRCLF